MTKIKLCGMMRDCDIGYVNEAMPDYIGFVFAESRRRVTPEAAERMRKRLAPEICAVGVFVNEKIENIAALVKNGVIDAVQLHGDEDENYIKALKYTADCDIIKAVRVKNADDVSLAQTSGADMLLFDKYVSGAYGGTGEMTDLSFINSERPFFIAGGINAANVENVIRSVRPFGVDLSSGIETDGVKDRDKIIDTVRRIRNV